MLNQKTNTINLKDIGIGIIFTILLIGMGFTQTGLKENPQKIMIGFGGILLILKIFREENLSTLMFYILIGILLYVAIFIGIGYIVHKLNPDAGWIEINGERQRVMNMNWIWGVLGGIILSPIIIRKYHKSINRNKILELIFVAFFVIITTIIYVKYELK